MYKNNKGFSLVELSIVVIILGLLVASVTVGKDLIKAAQIRALIAQLHSYDTQVNTFQLKYNALPGDIRNADKRGLGTHNGDGNYALEDFDKGDPDTLTGELVYFWEHLDNAGFADGAYDGDETNGLIGETIPRAKNTGGITVYSVNGINYYHVGADNATGSPKEANFIDTLVPEDGFSIDNKLDDGFPLKGKVLARSKGSTTGECKYSCASLEITEATGGASQVPGEACVLQASSSQNFNLDEYDFETSVVKCQLRIEMQ
jgi:prepilin-type N-terminal cleavage/methylation domain-containing protein